MNPSNPVFAFIILFITFFTGYFINLFYKLKPVSHRFGTIDGLRGFLAIGVFIHHSNIWYKYLHTGNWVAPESYFFNQLGQTGVALFFMISSFLFVNKLINFKGQNYDWKSFYMRRFFRLAPLHFIVVIGIIIIVFMQSNWTLNVSYTALGKSIIKWFSFGIFGFDKINDFNAALINAGVLWSLPYEWLLYFSLPLIALIVLKSKPSTFFILLSIVFIITTNMFRGYGIQHLLSFLGGAIAPVISKYYKKETNYNSLWFTITLLISTVLIFQFHSSSNHLCKLFITISFTIIALGNNIFGLLKSNTLKLLGEISYSTYLLHGVIIFLTINYVYGLQDTKSLSQTEYCVLIFLIAPIVILISFLSFKFIEKPFIEKSKRNKHHS